MKVIPIKGAIVSNDDRWFYQMMEMDATAPKDVVLPTTGEDIEVQINSGGGDVYAGSEIYTLLRDYQGRVTVKILGLAASAASVIAMAGDRVEISPTAQLMIHNVTGTKTGDYEKIKDFSQVLEGFNLSIANAYADKTKKSHEELLALMKKETWFTAQSAVEQGFCDGVMFEKETAPLLVASASPVVPHDVIQKMRNALTPDVEKLAGLVAEKLAEKKEAKTETKTRTASQGLGRFVF